MVTAPVPWEAMRTLEPAEGTGRRLVEAGLLSPFQAAADEVWWAPHRLVTGAVTERWNGDASLAHRRLGEWFQARFKEESIMLWAQRAVEYLCEAGEANEAWPTAQTLAIHLRGLGRFREALGWVERVLAVGPTGHRRGMALVQEVHLLRMSGSLEADNEAKLLEALRLVQIQERGWVLDGLGLLLEAYGRLREAGRYYEQAVLAHIESVGENTSTVAISLHNLAGVLQAQGDLSGAREKLVRSLEIKAAVFGTEEHPDVAASLHSLAGVLKAQGDLAGARDKLVRSLEIKAAVFGTEEHPDVAASLHELAGVLKAQGDLAGARDKLERSLEIKAAVFGTEEHPDVAASLHSLAGVLKAQGDLAGARDKLERSLEISAAVFGTEEHPDVAASLHELAGVLKAQGDLAGARDKLERVLEIEIKIYGTREHYSTAITEMVLGFLLIELDEKEKGAELLAHAYAVFQAQLGPEHPYTQQLASLFESGNT